MTDLSLGPRDSRSAETRSPEAYRSQLTTATTTEAQANVIQIDPPQETSNNNAPTATSREQVLSPNNASDEQRNSTANAINTAVPMTSVAGANQLPLDSKRSSERPRKSRVLDPSGSLFHHWSMVVSLAFLYNFWSLSYRFAFQEIDFETVVVWFALDYSADLIYVLDVVINFHAGYLEDGVLQRNIDKISVHYRECTQFYLDCFCLLPLDILYLSIGFNSILRCTRLVKIYKFWSYVERAERHTNYPNIFRTFTLVHYILVIFHWNACIFHMISKNRLIDIENLYKINDNHCDDILCQYLKAFYWSTLALTTVGDLPRPRTKGEYVYVTVELFFGLFLFASVLGYVANIVTNVSAARKEFQAKLDAVKTFMRMRRVSDDLQSKVIRWFDYLWISQKSSDEDKSVACLPDRLKAEIAIHVHLDTLKRVDIFQNTEAGFLCELVLRLKPVLFSPGDYVCRKNEVGHEMYIVSRGILEVVTNEGKTVVATLKAGSYFGEISMLNVGPAGNRRTASVRSVGYSDLFCLNKQDLWDVLKNYPNAEARIRARAEERLSKLSDPSKPRKLNGNGTSGVISSVKQPASLNQNQPNQFTQGINRSGRSDSYTGSLLVSSNLRQATSCSSTTTGGGVGSHRRRVCSSSSCSKPTKFIAARGINKHSNSTIEIDSSNLTSNMVAGKGGGNPFTKSHKVLCSTRRCLCCNARLNNSELIVKRSTVPKNDIRDCGEELDDISNGKAEAIEDEDPIDCDAASDDRASQSACSGDYEEDNLLPECQTPAKSRSDCFGWKSAKSSRGLACVCVKHGPAPSDTNKPLYRKSRLIERRPNVARKPVLGSLSRRNQVFIGADVHLDDDQEYDPIPYASPVGHSRSFEAARLSGQTILSPPYYESRLANRMTNGTDASRFLEPNDRRQQHRYQRSESFSVKSVDSSLSGYLHERRRNRQLLADQLSPQPALHETLAGRFDGVGNPYPPAKRRLEASPSESAPDSAKSMPPSNQQIHPRAAQRTQHGLIPSNHSPFKEMPSDRGSHYYPVQLTDPSATMKRSTGRFNQLIASGRSPASSLETAPSHVQIPVQVSVAQADGQYLRVPVAISTNSTILQAVPSQQTIPASANITTTPVFQSRSMSQLTPVQLITTAIPPSTSANLSLSLDPISEGDPRILLQQGQQQYLLVSTGVPPDLNPLGTIESRESEVSNGQDEVEALAESAAPAPAKIDQASAEAQEESSRSMTYSNDSDTVFEQIQTEVVTHTSRERLTSSSTSQSQQSAEKADRSSET